MTSQNILKYINCQIDAQILFIYIISIYMFQAITHSSSGGHIIVYMQHLVSSLFRSGRGGRIVHRLSRKSVLTQSMYYTTTD